MRNFDIPKLERIVSRYKLYGQKQADHYIAFCAGQASLKDAIQVAAKAVDEHNKTHFHQRRVGRAELNTFAEKLANFETKLKDATTFDEISIIPTFVLTPLTYLGGVFYSINSLPEFWQNVSKVNPIIYMVDGFRFGFYGISSINILYSGGLLVVMNIFLFGLNWYLLKKGYGLKN